MNCYIECKLNIFFMIFNQKNPIFTPGTEYFLVFPKVMGTQTKVLSILRYVFKTLIVFGEYIILALVD